MGEADFTIANALVKISNSLQTIAENQNKQFKDQFANSVEISNANSKGELHVTIKGRSDGDLETLVQDCLKQFNEAKTTGGKI